MNRRQFVGAAAGLAFASAASSQQPGRPPVALVLGGGGRGYGHIDVLRVLEKHGLKLDLVVGSNAGSLVGALHAAGLSAAAIERLGARLSPNTLRDWVFPNLGVFSGAGIARFVRA